jgi:predicted ATPase/DNA-binding CsgD family transcriptional regulator
LTLLATSREPIGVPGEVSWRVPSLSLADEAVELFTDRARRVRPDLHFTDEDTAAVEDICRRLDGMPLAIELAAARIRALSLTEILDGLRDRFRLLTGGARTAVRRQQTLRASVDWSHALLSGPERVLFRRLAVFMGGFDLDAAQAVTAGGEVQLYQVLDQLTLLVDKSLVVADTTMSPTRYRLLETVRQYALEKLGESGEADEVRARHRDHYAASLFETAQSSHERQLDQAETEMDNLRAAFAWSREHSDIELALRLASSLQPLWLARGRMKEGLAWFDAVLPDGVRRSDLEPAVHARALTDKAVLAVWIGAPDGAAQAERAVAIAREIDDPALLARALSACGSAASFNAEVARPYLGEAIDLSRAVSDPCILSQILGAQAYDAMITGDPTAARTAAEEGRDIADAIGDRFLSQTCSIWGGWALMVTGDLAGAAAQNGEVLGGADASQDRIGRAGALIGHSHALAYQGEFSLARAEAHTAVEAAVELGGVFEGFAYFALAIAALAAGDTAAAQDAGAAASQRLIVQPNVAAIGTHVLGEAALARGDLLAGRRWGDDAVSTTTGWHQVVALTTRARVTIAQGEFDRAERDAHDALALAADINAQLGIPDILECLGTLASGRDSHREAARLFGAAHVTRRRLGSVRFKIHDADCEAAVTALRDVMGEEEFDAAWAEGVELSVDEGIAYAQRGRGERKRPSSGWASLTPTERDVVRLVGEGLANKAIAARLFVSPRTVHTHLTHVYTKLGLSSRVQLAQEAARHI